MGTTVVLGSPGGWREAVGRVRACRVTQRRLPTAPPLDNALRSQKGAAAANDPEWSATGDAWIDAAQRCLPWSRSVAFDFLLAASNAGCHNFACGLLFLRHGVNDGSLRVGM